MNKIIIIESKINPDNNREYQARLNANYNLTVSPELAENTHLLELRSFIESELKNGMSEIVYGDIKKEMRNIIEVCSNLYRVRGYEYTDDDILKEQMKKLEEVSNNILNLCVF